MKTNWTLLAKVIAREANENEIREFETWSRKNMENKKLFDMLKKNWDSLNQEEKPIRVDVEGAWNRLHKRLEREQLIPAENKPQAGRFRLPPAWRIAAAVILLVSLGALAYTFFAPVNRGIQMTASTRQEQKFGLKLPDGSTVDMNAESSLRYKLQRSGVRTVRLEGEAFFDVANDPVHPFIIEAGQGIIEVTGTSFSVRTVPGGDRIEVYVESGNVRFFRSREEEHSLSLKAGETAVLEKDRLSRNVNLGPNHLSWKTRKLKFRESRLGDVASILNRTYSQEIRFTDESLEDCLFTGTFDQQPIDSVVRVIQVAFGLELDRDGKAYVFSGEGCN